ncbi:FtsK/SpoIIIE domain-containing protein [Virgibacillus sp. CBA3643]|uniref:FtsK/SpoIIIE domain-containing protein n=1 Tax=Virgibacillus sp. CBA3643 TaxID=2942278 RepID=UPI0035A38056
MDALIGGSLAAFIIYAAAKWKVDDKKKIQHTFENIGYKVGDHTPRLIKTHKTETYTTYTYNVPFGLVDDDKLEVLEKVLNKPVKVSFANQKLHIKAYKEKLKDNYNYDLFESKGNWTIPVGMSQEGIIYHDFDQVPHMTVAGATTWGKTVFMKMLMTHLIEINPNGVEFYMLDLKGALAFHRYSNLKQVKAVAGNHKESANALKIVEKSVKNDMKEFKKIYAENAKEANIPTRKFIIIDEAGELVPDKTMSDDDKEHSKTCQRILSYIARVSGQLGYKLIFGTQYPTADILNNQIKANSLAKVSFRLSTSVQSNVALDQSGAETLECPGRAIYKTVDEHKVQTPFISNKEIWDKLRRYEINDDPTTEETTEGREDTVTFG